MIQFKWCTFSELSVSELYAVLALRSDVFVREQQCAYLDLDGKDQSARHLLGSTDDAVGAYLRLFPPLASETCVVFGRVVTAPSMRSRGYGKLLIQEMLNYCAENFKGIPVQCSAQLYLKHFYEGFGFKAFGDVYGEDNIPHIAMKL